MSIKNIYSKKSYCNPLSIPQCPKANAYGYLTLDYTGETYPDYRSIADPSVLYYDNKWYMYPSYGMCFVSEDFATWKHIRTEPYDMMYSPSVIPYDGKFLMTSSSHGLYIGEAPTGPFEYLGKFIMPDGTETEPLDSALFLDDDGRSGFVLSDCSKKEHKRMKYTLTHAVKSIQSGCAFLSLAPLCPNI